MKLIIADGIAADLLYDMTMSKVQKVLKTDMAKARALMHKTMSGISDRDMGNIISKVAIERRLIRTWNGHGGKAEAMATKSNFILKNAPCPTGEAHITIAAYSSVTMRPIIYRITTASGSRLFKANGRRIGDMVKGLTRLLSRYTHR